jgi:hypothetical protein
MATLAQIITKVNADLDLDEEIFIDEDEKIAAANASLEVLEAAIIQECPEYFKSTPHTINLVSGTQDYDLPTDIYANKMNLIYYSNGSSKYEIGQIKDLRQIINIEAGQPYKYLIVNSTASGTKIRFYPSPAETTSSAINIFYTRNIKRFTATTDELEAPEAEIFVKEFIKEQAIKKERMTPDAPMSQHLKDILTNIIGALKVMVVDENNVVPMDNDLVEALCYEGDY